MIPRATHASALDRALPRKIKNKIQQNGRLDSAVPGIHPKLPPLEANSG
jgi:hypothetical protein